MILPPGTHCSRLSRNGSHMSTHTASIPFRWRLVNSVRKYSSSVSFLRSFPNHNGSAVSDGGVPSGHCGAVVVWKVFIQRLLLALLPKPQRLRSFQMAHHRQKLVLLAPVQFIHPHMPQRRLPPAGLATLQVP